MTQSRDQNLPSAIAICWQCAKILTLRQKFNKANADDDDDDDDDDDNINLRPGDLPKGIGTC